MAIPETDLVGVAENHREKIECAPSAKCLHMVETTPSLLTGSVLHQSEDSIKGHCLSHQDIR